MPSARKIKVILVHGWDGSPAGNWFPWLTQQLQAKGYFVLAPAMPNPQHPKRDPWVSALAWAIDGSDENVILVGHSLGCITILRYLETLAEGKKILGAVLVAGFSEPIGYDEIKPFFTPPLNYDLVKNHCQQFIALNSTDDPYVPLARGTTFEKKLGARLMILPDAGHIGSEDGFTTLPEVLSAISSII